VIRALRIIVALGVLAGTAAASPAQSFTLPAEGLDLHAQLHDGTRVVLPPMAIAQDRPAVDRRPIYIGAGLVVLALVFYWNRRGRDRFEREETPEAPATSDDADGDDLHAAARGDAKDDV